MPERNGFFAELKESAVSIAKGMWVTLKNFGRSVILRQAVTVTAYDVRDPSGHRPIASRYRGTMGLTIDWRTLKHNCIGCLQCERICPDHCIFMEVEKREGHTGQFPTKFVIDYNLCSFCGLCVEVCPTPALIFTERFDVGGYTHDDLIFHYTNLLEFGEWQQREHVAMAWEQQGKDGANGQVVRSVLEACFKGKKDEEVAREFQLTSAKVKEIREFAAQVLEELMGKKSRQKADEELAAKAEKKPPPGPKPVPARAAKAAAVAAAHGEGHAAPAKPVPARAAKAAAGENVPAEGAASPAPPTEAEPKKAPERSGEGEESN